MLVRMACEADESAWSMITCACFKVRGLQTAAGAGEGVAGKGNPVFSLGFQPGTVGEITRRKVLPTQGDNAKFVQRALSSSARARARAHTGCVRVRILHAPSDNARPQPNLCIF